MNNVISILGFAGSLRKGSYNRALLRAAVELTPEDATLEIFDLEGIPPFNQDLEASMPERVKDFKSKIPSGIEAFKEEVSPYIAGKGTMQFPLDKPIPYDLKEKIVIFRARENLAKKKKYDT